MKRQLLNIYRAHHVFYNNFEDFPLEERARTLARCRSSVAGGDKGQ